MSEEREGEVRSLGTSGTRQCDFHKLIRTLQAKGKKLHFVSEAGLCGYYLYRYLTKKKFTCWVGAPSSLPQKSGVALLIATLSVGLAGVIHAIEKIGIGAASDPQERSTMRLDELLRLRDKGLFTQEEYEKRWREILER